MMVLLSAIALVAAGASGEAPAGASFRQAPIAASAPARATVRILPGAKVNLSASAERDGYRLNPATVTVEDGSRRPARLIEFQ